jgi:transcriptional regulator with XRE-family HTH domain
VSDDAPDLQVPLEEYETAIRLLAAARRGAKLTQLDVAAEMETVQSAVSDIERLVTMPNLMTFARYAKSIGAQVELCVWLPKQVDEIIATLSPEQWRDAILKGLGDLGLTWAELEERARARSFRSIHEQKLWYAAGGAEGRCALYGHSLTQSEYQQGWGKCSQCGADVGLQS